MPGRVAKPALAIRAEREDRKAKEAKLEPEQTAEEKKAGEYRCNITRMIHDIESVDWLIKIYFFIKVFADDKEGIADE